MVKCILLNNCHAPQMDFQPCNILVRFPIPIQQPKLNPISDPLMMKQEKPAMTVKRQRILKLAEPNPQRWLPLPLWFSRLSIEDIEPKLIFNRKLTASDVNSGLMRLAMPRTQILNTFLTGDEENTISQKDSEGKMKKIHVGVIDSALNVRGLSLTRWNYKNSTNWSYVLSGGWNKIVKSNKFASGDEIGVWAYRMQCGSLVFVIDKLVAADDLNRDRDLVWGKKRKRGSNRQMAN